MKFAFLNRLVSLCSILVLVIHFSSPAAGSKADVFGFTILRASGIDTYDAKVYSQILRGEIDKLGVYRTLEFSDITLRLAEQELPR